MRASSPTFIELFTTNSAEERRHAVVGQRPNAGFSRRRRHVSPLSVIRQAPLSGVRPLVRTI